MPTAPEPLSFTRLTVLRGCRAFDIAAHQTAQVVSATRRGAEYGYSTLLVVKINGRQHAFSVRAWKFLEKAEFNANKGDPTKSVRFAPVRA
jgi:hypothetical protein